MRSLHWTRPFLNGCSLGKSQVRFICVLSLVMLLTGCVMPDGSVVTTWPASQAAVILDAQPLLLTKLAELEAAVAELETALMDNPWDTVALHRLLALHQELAVYKNVLSIMHPRQPIDPTLAQADVARGQLLLASGQLLAQPDEIAAALDAFNAIIEHAATDKPDNATLAAAYHGRAVATMASAPSVQEVIGIMQSDQYEEFTFIDPESSEQITLPLSEARVLASERAKERLSVVPQAEQDFLLAIELDPTSAVAKHDLGVLYLTSIFAQSMVAGTDERKPDVEAGMAQMSQTSALFNEAITLAPDWLSARYSRAMAQLLLGLLKFQINTSESTGQSLGDTEQESQQEVVADNGMQEAETALQDFQFLIEDGHLGNGLALLYAITAQNLENITGVEYALNDAIMEHALTYGTVMSYLAGTPLVEDPFKAFFYFQYSTEQRMLQYFFLTGGVVLEGKETIYHNDVWDFQYTLSNFENVYQQGAVAFGEPLTAGNAGSVLYLQIHGIQASLDIIVLNDGLDGQSIESWFADRVQSQIPDAELLPEESQPDLAPQRIARWRAADGYPVSALFLPTDDHMYVTIIQYSTALGRSETVPSLFPEEQDPEILTDIKNALKVLEE